MSNLLQTERVETVIVPLVFAGTNSAVGNFQLPFDPKVLQISQICNFTDPVVAELVIFKVNGRSIGASFSNSALSGLSNPVFFKNDANMYWGQAEVSAYNPSGAQVALTGSMVFVMTCIK